MKQLITNTFDKINNPQSVNRKLNVGANFLYYTFLQQKSGKLFVINLPQLIEGFTDKKSCLDFHFRLSIGTVTKVRYEDGQVIFTADNINDKNIILTKRIKENRITDSYRNKNASCWTVERSGFHPSFCYDADYVFHQLIEHESLFKECVYYTLWDNMDDFFDLQNHFETRAIKLFAQTKK